MLFHATQRSAPPEVPVILIAEDEDNDLCLIKRAFQKLHFENPLMAVRDGEAAIAYLRGTAPFCNRAEHPAPALVLLDLKMPRKDGFEVLAWIRDQPEFNHLPVVILTSSQESVDVSHAYALGANSYLVKPASFASLVDMFNRLREYCTFTQQNVGLSWT